MDYQILVQGIESGLQRMKIPLLTQDEFRNKLEAFKHFNYAKLSDDEIFWMLTRVLFFNMGRKASMIEKKLPLFKEYLYGYRQLSQLPDAEIKKVIFYTGFRKQVNWCVENGKIYKRIIQKYGSFQGYLLKKFAIEDIYCSNGKLLLLYEDLKIEFIGIGETAGWHYITELGFFSLKPDKVIRRIFYRLGLIKDEEDLEGAIDVGRNISKKLDISIRYIDIIFVKYGQVGQSDLLGTVDGICTERNPKCDICTVSTHCRYKGKGIIELEKDLKEKGIKVEFQDKPIENNQHKTEIKKEQKDNLRGKIVNFKEVAGTKEGLVSIQSTSYQIDLSIVPKLQKKYEKLSAELQEVFQELIRQSQQYCTKHFPTNTPDYRLQKNHNFCLITFLTSEQLIRVHLRTDGLKLPYSNLEVRNLLDHNFNGKEWVVVQITKKSEVEELIGIIKAIYESQ